MYASAVALTHWAVGSRRITPFGAWPRPDAARQRSGAAPLERRVVRAGGSPQDAPLWLIGIVIAGGLLLLTLVHWLAGFVVTLEVLAGASPACLGEIPRERALHAADGGAVRARHRLVGGPLPLPSVVRPVFALTDWLIEPIRRILPPFGMLDFSPLVAWLLLSLLRELRGGDAVIEVRRRAAGRGPASWRPAALGTGRHRGRHGVEAAERTCL